MHTNQAPGWLYRHRKNFRQSLLTDCISIAGFDQGFVINKDGSLALGFALSLVEEESLSHDGFVQLITELSAAIEQLPLGTVIQKLDIYHQASFELHIPSSLPFFHANALAHHHNRPVLKHTCVLFLRFFAQPLTPITTFLALKTLLTTTALDHLEAKQEEASRAAQAFITALPTGLRARKLTDKEHEQLLYQYLSLTFHRSPIGFERSITIEPDRLAMGLYLKAVAMKAQGEEVFYSKTNNLGAGGVTACFSWPLTHFAPFDHILCQTIALVDDQKLRKNKGLEFEYNAQLKLQPRSKELAQHLQARFLALEKRLDERNARLVKLSLATLTWHADPAILQDRTDQLKSAFSKLGIDASETAADTDNTFFANIPGGTGFVEGCYMPLDTALAHLNWITPPKGDCQGILLQDRHGNPIYYDPFKYSLDNQHAFVFGPSGSGKSFFNGKMIKDRFYLGHTVVVIDTGGTYRFLFQALGGKYIAYDPERPLHLNPFLIKPNEHGHYRPETDKVAFLVSFLAKIWKGDLAKDPLSELEHALLSKFITLYYQDLKPNSIPHLTGFCTWLKAYVKNEDIAPEYFNADTFFIVLEPFTVGVYKDHFNALDLEYLQDQKLLCFELEAVKNDRKLYPLVIQVLFDYVLQLLATQAQTKKFIDIEEGWSMLDDASEGYIEAFFRKGRKSNTAIRIITQDVAEIKASRIAGAMKNNAATLILLYNDKASIREEIAQYLGLDSFDMEKYASLKRSDHYQEGYREVFIKQMDRSAVWLLSTSLQEHGLLTSRPDERHAIEALLQSQGSIEQAVSLWAQSIQNQR